MLGGGADTNLMYAPMNSTAVSCVNGASTLLLATSTSRQFLQISNSGSKTVWIGYGAAAATSTGSFLVASSSMTLDNSRLFGGAIYCLGDTATSIVTISESK